MPPSTTRVLKTVHTSSTPWERCSADHKTFLSDINNQKDLLEWIGQTHLQIQKIDDWYKVKVTDFRECPGGTHLISKHGSLFKLLQRMYPQVHWLPWKFRHVPQNYWSSKSHHRLYFDWVGKELGVKTSEDWYNIGWMDVVKKGGSRLLKFYGNSLHKALCCAYPEVEFHGWKFKRAPNAYYRDFTNMYRFIVHLSEQLGIGQLSDWYRVSSEQLRSVGAFYAIRKYGGLYLVLKRLYADYPWNIQLFMRSSLKNSTQRKLFQVVQRIFPDHAVFENYAHPTLKYNHTPSQPSTTPLQLDVFIPDLSLAFEYQKGEQHYRDIYHFGPQARYAERDKMKRRLCNENNITLIEIPYWWDRALNSVEATIHEIRPDLVAVSTGKPIPSVAPHKMVKHNLKKHIASEIK